MKKNKKTSKKSKKSKKKKNKENSKKEKDAEKLYEIDDIDLLCSMIEDTDKKNKNIEAREKLMKRKELVKNGPRQEKSPNKNKNKAIKKEIQNLGKENKSMNKTLNKDLVKGKNKTTPKKENSSPATKMKRTEHDQSHEPKTSNPNFADEECKELEALRQFLLNCVKSKRKVSIKPNIPKKWINDLRAKLTMLKSQ